MAKVLHLDIKPENILVGEDGSARFGDFGISRLLNKKTEWLTHSHGTMMYHPPETFLTKSFKALPLDIWALGMSMYFLATGTFPFQNRSNLKEFRMLVATQEYYDG